MRTALVTSVLVLAACGGQTSAVEPTSPAQGDPAADRAHAIEVARALGAQSGYAEAEHELESAELAGEGAHAGHWLVSFVHVDPAPPGGRFSVYVDPASWQGELMRGE